MATKIVTKNSSTASAVPTASDLVQGELAVNVADKRLFTEDNAGAIVELGTNPYNFTANHNGSAKLSTTSTGIDVTGTVTADGLTVSGTAGTLATLDRTGSNGVYLALTDNSGSNVFLGNSGGQFQVQTAGASYSSKLTVESNGDISFYEDTGTTPKLFWDASAESLGIGTTSAPSRLTVKSPDNTLATNIAQFDSLNGGAGFKFGYQRIEQIGVTTPITFETGGSESMRIDSSGRVGIGIVPETWNTSFIPMQLGNSGYIYGRSAQTAMEIGNNAYFGGSGWAYTTTNTAQRYIQDSTDNAHKWFNAASGTADTSLSWSERMRIDSSGNLLVGTTDDVVWNNSANSSADNGHNLRADGRAGFAYYNATANANATVNVNRTGADGDLIRLFKSGTTVGSIASYAGTRLSIGSASASGLLFGGSSILPQSNNVAADATQDLGGSGNRFKDLYLSGGVSTNTATGLSITADSSNRGILNLSTSTAYQLIGGSYYGYTGYKTGGYHRWFGSDGSEDMRIDSSGNLLVGKTASNSTVSGSQLNSNGLIIGTTSATNPLLLNRLSTHGDIITMQKDGASVGHIGVQGSRPYFGNSINFSIKCDDANNGSLIPSNQSGVPNNNVSDIGLASNRWNDLYLGGGVYLGGTGAANKLDDYEEGTFTPTVIGSTTTGTATYSHQKGVYTKIGNVVTVQIYLNWSSGTGAGVLRFSNLPFTLYATSGFYSSATIGEYSSIAGTAGHTLCAIGLPNTVDIQFAENDFSSAPTTTAYDAAGYIVLSMTYLAA